MNLEFLASDELGGRYTLGPNFGIAARYLATRLQAFGYKGGGDQGGFFQKFDVISSRADADKMALTLTSGGQSTDYKFGDFLTLGASTAGEAQGQVVFVGAGVSSPSQKHDDYAGLDVKGKVVLIAPIQVTGIDTSRVGDNERGEGAARAHGAVGVLTLLAPRFADRLKDRAALDRLISRETIRLAKDTEGHLPSVTVGPAIADKILGACNRSAQAVFDAAEKKEPVTPCATNTSVKFNVALQQTRTTTQNVVGILEGTDPKLKDEYVTFSAHYDHLKTGANGEIYHGADDDGSGTTAVVSIAHAMSLNRPKRSVMIIFHAGEELGLLGSQYNTDIAPAVPLNKVVVDLNIDMIGRSKPAGDTAKEDEHLTAPDAIYLVGSNRISPELHQISEATNAEFQKLKLDYYYNDPNNPERIYYRSDHWNYAKHGIPIIFYFDGTHVDYHRPTDTVDKIDFNKLTQVARLVFETGWRIANLDHRLTIAS